MRFEYSFVVFAFRMSGSLALVMALAGGATMLITGCGELGDGHDGDGGTGGFVADRPACTGSWTGGTFSGGGAIIDVTPGKVSMCAGLKAAPVAWAVDALPEGFPFDESSESVLTAGGDAVAVEAGKGFDVDAEGSVTIAIPYEPLKLPSDSPVENSTNTFVRVWDPATGMAHDLNGHVNQIAQTVTVELTGLPADATMAVINRPARVAVTTSDPAWVSLRPDRPDAPVDRVATPFGTWAGRDWCVIHDYDSAELRDAVSLREGYGRDPTPEEIAASVRARVAQAGRDAQAIYESIGLRAPWLYVSDDPDGPCGQVLGSTPRYEIHVIDLKGSHYRSEDENEATGPEDTRYGRIYIRSRRIGDDVSTDLGTVKASVAHEMVHAIQKGYEILARSVGGLNEGTATVAGLYVDRGSIAVRSPNGGETFMMPWFLMMEGDYYSYANQDFFAFAARRYGGSSLAFLPVVFQAMNDSINSDLSGATTPAQADGIRALPGTYAVHRAIDAALNQVVPGFGLSLAYKDFVTERLFFHAPETQFGRTGETVSGFAAELFPGAAAAWDGIREMTASMDQCVMSRGTAKFDTLWPMSSRAIRIRATDVPQPARLGDLQVTLASADGDAVVGWGWRDGALQTLDGPTVFEDFGGYDGEELVVVVSNVALSADGQDGVTVEFSLACDAETPDGEDPMECGSQSSVMACNKVPSLYYWNRSCEEYTGSHWYADPSGLDGMCTITTDAEWCTTGCARDHVMGTCSMSMGDNAEVVYYFYDTVEYDPADIDPSAWCAENGGGWSGL